MTSDDDEPGGSRFRWLVAAMVLLLIPLVIIWWPGCREYPPVSSRESLKLMQLLNSACNTKDPQRLAMVEKQLAELSKKDKVSAKEKLSFEKIVSMARAGKWEDAEAAAFKMAQDQVGVGHPDPAGHSHNHHKKK